jgi:hypothetical protein
MTFQRLSPRAVNPWSSMVAGAGYPEYYYTAPERHWIDLN